MRSFVIFVVLALMPTVVTAQSQELIDIVKAIGTMPDGPRAEASNKLIEGVKALAVLSEMNARDIDMLRARTSGLPVEATDDTEAPIEVRSGFRRHLRMAIRDGVKSGRITRIQGLKLRTAVHSPAFARQAEDLAVVQLAFSGETELPMTETGAVDRASIDWSKWIDLFKLLLPLLLQLLEGL